MLPVTDARKPYPLSWEEQTRLFKELPVHLAQMALFKVNTGTREKEVCYLRWEWEVPVAELGTSVFIIPEDHVKNGEERLLVLNRVARSVIDEVRGVHPEYVFTYRGHPITAMNNTGWQNARKRVGLSQVRVHDLKHTFGRRLRAAGVSYEDRQDLLGHKSGRITTHYSAAELENLIEASNLVCGESSRKSPALTTSEPTNVSISINFTRLPCLTSVGCAGSTESDSDHVIGLSDRSTLVAGSAGDGVYDSYDGVSSALEYTDLGNTADLRSSLTQILFTDPGYPAIGDSFDINIDFILSLIHI